MKMIKITVDLCTRQRYEILCDTLLAILNQTYSVSEIIIYDDTPIEYRKDLRLSVVYYHLFMEMDKRSIKWQVKFGDGKGQVRGHQWIKDNASYDWIWRIDDDEIPEINVLENLINTIKNEKSIVSCLIPFHFSNFNSYNGPNLIANYKTYNSQWIYDLSPKIDHCEHLYSSFLYNRKHTLDYCLDLSPVGHREETIFTYRNYKHGCNLLVNRNCIIWHKRYGRGGIRSDVKKENFQMDEMIGNRIIENLKRWNRERIFPIIGGIGDNYAFMKLFGNNISKLNGIIATSYKNVYKDMDVEIISIQDAKDILSDRVIDNLNVYKFMAKNNWKKSIGKAYKKMFEF